jgi:hypothetical protein
MQQKILMPKEIINYYISQILLSSEMDDVEFDEYWRLRESTLSALNRLPLKIEVADFFENVLLIYKTASLPIQNS